MTVRTAEITQALMMFPLPHTAQVPPLQVWLENRTLEKISVPSRLHCAQELQLCSQTAGVDSNFTTYSLCNLGQVCSPRSRRVLATQ